MADLLEGQWELDGFVFGGPGQKVWIVESGLDLGSADSRTQDADNSTRDGGMFGRDYLNGPEMGFTLGVQDGIDVWPVIADLKQAWRADAVRSTPGAMSTLRYREAGQTYRLFGRGRKCDVVPAKKKNTEFQQVTATFKLAGPEQCIEPAGGGTNSATLALIPAPTGGGVRLPARLPWRLAPGSRGTTGSVTVGGVIPAAFQVTVHGPVSGYLSGISLSGDGWEFATSAKVAYDQTLVLDTRTQSVTVAGQSIAGTLSRESRLTARLQTGPQTLTFDGDDPTNTAYAVVSWLDTIPA